MKSVLLNTTVIGSSVKLPRHPRLIIGEPGKYIHGDILDANAVTTEIDNKISAVIDNAPDALDTLKEIANSLNNDADLAGTLFSKLEQLNQKIDDQSNNQTTALEETLAAVQSQMTSIENTLRLKDEELEDRVEVLEEVLTWGE